MDEFLITTQDSLMNIDNDPPSSRRLLIYSSRIEDGKKLEEVFSKTGTRVQTTNSVSDAKRILERNDFSMLVVAVANKDCDGMKLLEWTNDTILGIKKIGIAKNQCVELYNKVYKLGADHLFYFDSLVIDKLTLAIEELHKNGQRWFERKSGGFQGCSKRIISECSSDATLLLAGPHGVGKSAIARLIHDNSPRRSEPFIVAECAHYMSAAETMDIFRGKELGIKHPLYRNQQGLLAQANRGTLFIHEVCHLPIHVQEVLATVVQRGVFTPQNLTKEVKFSGRIIFSTNVDLAEKVRAGEFSEALYHCIHSNVLRVPPLSDCLDDVIPLAECFIRQYCAENGLSVPRLTKGAINKLNNHIWVSNVRELYSTIVRACSEYRGDTIGKEDITLYETQKEVSHHSRKYRVTKALQHTKGNKAQAAKLLEINRTTLYAWMKAEGISKDYR